MEQSILEHAVAVASQAHHGSYRKGSKQPYLLHVLEAATVAATMTCDEEILAAAVLHDTVEDTPMTQEEIEAAFGSRVASLVADESEDKRRDLPPEQTWRIRKEEAIEHLKNASLDAKMVALGDKLSNMRAISRDYAALGDGLWLRFHQHDKSQHAWYYRSIADALSELAQYDAWQEYAALVERVFGE